MAARLADDAMALARKIPTADHEELLREGQRLSAMLIILEDRFREHYTRYPEFSDVCNLVSSQVKAFELRQHKAIRAAKEVQP